MAPARALSRAGPEASAARHRGGAHCASRFPNGDGKWEVSRGFGEYPCWGAKSDRIYIVDQLNRIAEIEVDLTTTFQLGVVGVRVPAQLS
jgi:hypothetical protein